MPGHGGAEVDAVTTVDDLLSAAIDLTSHLDLETVLGDLVDSAAELTGARYAAITVLDNRGEIANFVQHGVSPDLDRKLARPQGAGLLSQIPSHGHLLVEDIAADPAFSGWPMHHPEMTNLLGVAIRIHEQVYGRLYLAEKKEGFTGADARTIERLAAAAAVAVHNARRYALARDRERWVAVSQKITAHLLGGVEEEEALEFIAAEVRHVAHADAALIVLPSVGEDWVCEIADGEDTSDIIGTVFPPEGRAMTALANGTGMIIDSMSRARSLRVAQLGRYGPAMYAPMMAHGSGRGVLVLLRRQGGAEFVAEELAIAEAVAAQAALALELAAARQAEDVAALMAERQRIARDLHDIAIQQLFATAMQLDSARLSAAQDTATAGMGQLLDEALGGIEEAVRQIRVVVRSLREPGEVIGLGERLDHEVSLARPGLGFAPSLLISVDGRLRSDDETDVAGMAAGNGVAAALDDRVGEDIAGDVVAVVREGLANAARHAGATSVQVTVVVDDSGSQDHLRVEVRDNGIGLAETCTPHSGLDNLAARARQHGGTFSLTTPSTGQGTQLTWQVGLG